MVKKTKIDEPEEEKIDEPEEEVKKDKKNKETKISFEGGIRTYSEELHGKDHAKLAEEFVSKRPEVRKIV